MGKKSLLVGQYILEKSSAVQDFIDLDLSAFTQDEVLVMNDIVAIYHKSPAI